MLRQTFEEFKAWAMLLKSEEGIDYTAKGKEVIEQMANGYCLAKDNNDEHKKNLYISGLMLRFWYTIHKLKEKSPIQGLDYSDFMAWLYEAIEYACKYRAWQDPTKKVNAQQAINQCIETIRVQKYYGFNLQKNKANYSTISLEEVFEEDGKTTLLETLVDEAGVEKTKQTNGANVATDLIQNYINKKKIVEAIILDTIAFNDTQRIAKKVVQEVDADGKEFKTTRQTTEFWPFRCVQILSNLPEDYAKYFCNNYKIIEKELDIALDVIRRANNQKLYKFLTKTLADARTVFSYA